MVRGMVWAGGSASRIIDNRKTADPGGGERVAQPRGTGWHGSCLRGVLVVRVCLRVCRLFHYWGATRWYILQRHTGWTCCPAHPSPEQMDPAVGDSQIVLSGDLPSLVTSAPGARRAVRGMRPGGQNNPVHKEIGRHFVVTNNSVGIADKSSQVGEIDSSLDGGGERGGERHPEHVPSSGVDERNGHKLYMNSVPSRNVTRGGGLKTDCC